MITVLLVDDNQTTRATLRLLLEADPEISVVGEAGNGRSAVSAARRLRPQVTLLDHHMPIADGLSVIGEVSEHSAVLTLTSSDDPELIAPMLRGGARGYLVYGHFTPGDLLPAVRAVARGEGWLIPAAASVATTVMREAYARERALVARNADRQAVRAGYGLSEREREVVDLVAEGLSNGAVAQRLGLSEKTVKNHLNSIFVKLDVTSRTEALVRWRGWR